MHAHWQDAFPFGRTTWFLLVYLQRKLTRNILCYVQVANTFVHFRRTCKKNAAIKQINIDCEIAVRSNDLKKNFCVAMFLRFLRNTKYGSAIIASHKLLSPLNDEILQLRLPILSRNHNWSRLKGKYDGERGSVVFLTSLVAFLRQSTQETHCKYGRVIGRSRTELL